MKKQIPRIFLSAALIMFLGFQQGMAQGEKRSKVRVTITEGDEVTSDTTFELKGDRDPEMIKKMIAHLSGDEDIHVMHLDKDVHMSHSGGHKLVWISEDGEHTSRTAESMMDDINLDSIREAHGGRKVMVMKNEEGGFTVKELDGGHMEIKGKEKNIKVIVEPDEDLEWIGEGDEDGDVEVYVIRSGDGGEVKVVKKKVRVVVEDEDQGQTKADTEKGTEKTEKRKKN